MPLSEIVNVSITRETRVVTRAGFGTVLILGENLEQTVARRFAIFTDLATLATNLDGGVADPEYKAAQTLLSQSPRPTQFMVGHQEVGDASGAAALAAIQQVNDQWYGVVATYPTVSGRDAADQKLIMAWVETVRKLLIIADADANTLLDPDTTSLAYYAESMNYARTTVQYSGVADGTANDPYPEAGAFGTFVTRDPGSYTVMFKTPAGFAVDALGVDQSINARGKNALVFEEIGGVDILREGKVAEGEYIDVIVFVDWLQARMMEDVYGDLANLPKVPYTDAGIGIVEGRVKERLQKGVDVGGLTADTPFVVSVPASADVSAADKGNRILNDVTFSATLAGAIHATVITGVVSL